ncbi:MAG: hypothetical protein GTN68_45320 [Candidatus Aminicenantes bacterium]|nr:hypothetical protein [Candidatus Aminicenantes bacterium]
MRRIFQTLFILCLLGNIISVFADEPRYKNTSLEIEERVEDLLSRMTLEEKALMLSGDTTGFDSRPNERLGIPALRMTDGPVGVRWGKSVTFPASVCMAATWNPDLIYEYGRALGRETKAKGRNVILGPCVNIHRTPFAGRNFETFGEDPYLASRIVEACVRGVQDEQVIVTVKHFVCNNQEFERHSIDAKVDERTLHEIYFPAYKAAIDAGCWAVMASYNRINGHYACSNVYLLNDILKNRWGFKGFVMSDWGAVHSLVPTMYAGLDIEMPTAGYMTQENVIREINTGRMKVSKIDDKVRCMLRAMMATGIFDGKLDQGACDTPAHREIARKIAQQGIVLLKNENSILPLNSKKYKTVAVIGPNASVCRTGGGGSSFVTPTHAVSPLQGLKSGADQFEIRFAQGLYMDKVYKPIPSKFLRPPKGSGAEQGLLGEYFYNAAFTGEPVYTRVDSIIDFFWYRSGPKDLADEYFSIRWTGQLVPEASGKYILAITSDDGSRLYVNGKRVIDNWGKHGMLDKTVTLDLERGVPVNIKIEFYEETGEAGMCLGWERVLENPLTEAVNAAKESDVALVFLGNTHQIETEGIDRTTLDLPEGQVDLLKKIVAVNPNTVVILNCGASVNMTEWINDAPGIMLAWFPGQEGGNAIADLLLGNVNPSGKLSTTFFKKGEDCPAYGNYPGEDDTEVYAEGVFVGYRHLDKENIEPAFAFGHGLSYTTFDYSNLKLSTEKIKAGESIEVSCSVKNSGPVAGDEVVQLYLGDVEASFPRPVKELKGFKRISLKSGETKTVSFTIKHEDMAFFDICSKDWRVEPGQFKIYIGSSSRDIRLTGNFGVR